MSTSIIELDGVTFSYPGSLTVFENLKLRVCANRCLVVAGANGSGKSTLLLLLNGTLRPSHGEIRICENPIAYDRESLRSLRRRVGTVLQDPDDQLFAPTVEQDIAFGPLNSGMPPAQARVAAHAVMQSLAIEHLARRPIHELSLGEKKRVALAGVLIMKPDVVLLDEPTAGLDCGGVAGLLELLGELHRTGTTLILTTHDMDFALEWADEVAVLAGGRVQAQGSCVDTLSGADLLAAAHLEMPVVLETALQWRPLSPDVSNGALPRSRKELTPFIQKVIRARLCAKG